MVYGQLQLKICRIHHNMRSTEMFISNTRNTYKNTDYKLTLKSHLQIDKRVM